MASSTKIAIAKRIAALALFLLLLYYFGPPLNWKISATIHDIRHNNQTVTQGLSQVVMDTRKTVGWYRSDSGIHATSRKLLRYHVLWRVVA